MNEGIEKYIGDLHKALDRIDRGEISAFVEVLLAAYQRGASVFVCGNGGSASTASHFACDINKGVSYGLEKRFRVIPLTDNIATIMAYANDVGYEYIFVEQLKNFLRTDDLVVAFSGSGNSPNVLRAIEYANDNGAMTIGVTGYDGGSLSKIARMSVNANVNDMQISEDIHIVLCHLVMRLMLCRLSGRNIGAGD